MMMRTLGATTRSAAARRSFTESACGASCSGWACWWWRALTLTVPFVHAVEHDTISATTPTRPAMLTLAENETRHGLRRTMPGRKCGSRTADRVVATDRRHRGPLDHGAPLRDANPRNTSSTPAHVAWRPGSAWAGIVAGDAGVVPLAGPANSSCRKRLRGAELVSARGSFEPSACDPVAGRVRAGASSGRAPAPYCIAGVPYPDRDGDPAHHRLGHDRFGQDGADFRSRAADQKDAASAASSTTRWGATPGRSSIPRATCC